MLLVHLHVWWGRVQSRWVLATAVQLVCSDDLGTALILIQLGVGHEEEFLVGLILFLTHEGQSV